MLKALILAPFFHSEFSHLINAWPNLFNLYFHLCLIWKADHQMTEWLLCLGICVWSGEVNDCIPAVLRAKKNV